MQVPSRCSAGELLTTVCDIMEVASDMCAYQMSQESFSRTTQVGWACASVRSLPHASKGGRVRPAQHQQANG